MANCLQPVHLCAQRGSSMVLIRTTWQVWSVMFGTGASVHLSAVHTGCPACIFKMACLFRGGTWLARGLFFMVWSKLNSKSFVSRLSCYTNTGVDAWGRQCPEEAQASFEHLQCIKRGTGLLVQGSWWEPRYSCPLRESPWCYTIIDGIRPKLCSSWRWKRVRSSCVDPTQLHYSRSSLATQIHPPPSVRWTRCQGLARPSAGL